MESEPVLLAKKLSLELSKALSARIHNLEKGIKLPVRRGSAKKYGVMRSWICENRFALFDFSFSWMISISHLHSLVPDV